MMMGSIRPHLLARRLCLSSSRTLLSTNRSLRSIPTTSATQPSTVARPRFTSSSTSSTSKDDLKPYFVTTPIFYVNADPHIGHLYSDIIADVLARYHAYIHSGYSSFSRLGTPVEMPSASSLSPIAPVFSTGTDEHGLKIQKVAEAANEDPRQLCDRISLRFKELADAANIGYSHFIRTTDSDHRDAVETLWRTLREEDWIYQGKHEGWYAVSDEAFYPATQVRKVVKDGKEEMESIETGAKVEWSQETNYKFRLSAFREPLLKWLEENPKAIQPKQKYDEVKAEVEKGLEDLSISRPSSRLSWGIPVPDDPEHSIYVWVDALTNYLTVSGYPSSSAPYAWPADVHVVGKDILRFHAIYWPALLLAASIPPPKVILAHSHWTMNKAKMSKSRGNVANPFEAIGTFGLDTLRFFLMRVGGNFASDSDYNPSVLVEFHRKYLQGQLGNLVSRICAPKIHARLDEFARDAQTNTLLRPSAQEVASHLDDETHTLYRSLESTLAGLPGQVEALMAEFEVGKVLELIIESVIGSTNELIQRLEPWSASTHPVVVLETVILVTESLRISALLLKPFMPQKMDQLLSTLQVPPEKRVSKKDLIQTDAHGRLVSHVIQRKPGQPKVQPLFPPLQVAES